MAPSIPDRWLAYTTYGDVIPGTNIICFKVPLRKTVQTGNKNIPEIWDVKTLLEKIPNLGAVIDLTNTKRYYNPQEFTTAGVLHKKILMPGRIIPPEKTVKEFFRAVDDFRARDCGLIGVHCTHGLNRTGYMVCRYMRDRLSFDGQNAIRQFEEARGHKIERPNFVADIMRGSSSSRNNFGRYGSMKSPLADNYDSGPTHSRGSSSSSRNNFGRYGSMKSPLADNYDSGPTHSRSRHNRQDRKRTSKTVIENWRDR